jgi:ABC-type amino acid transport substrate-binding protein
MKKKTAVLPMMSLILLSMLTGCGSSSNEGKLRIGIECDYAPFNWSQSSSNDYSYQISNKARTYADGFDVQIAKKLAADLGKELEIVQTPWTSLIPDLQSNSFDCIISGMTDTEEREQSVSFSNEYYRSELVLITKKDVADANQNVLSEDSLKALIEGKIIISQVSTATNDLIDIFSNKCGANHGKPVSTFSLAAIDVSNGSAFAMTSELPVAKSIVANRTDLGIIHIDQSILGEELYQLGVSVALRKDSTDLKNSINSSIASMTEAWKLETMEAALARSEAVA